MSKRESDAAKVYIVNMKAARQARAAAVRLAEEQPWKVLQALADLSEDDRRQLERIKRIALAHV
jgi:hypothetical protein